MKKKPSDEINAIKGDVTEMGMGGLRGLLMYSFPRDLSVELRPEQQEEATMPKSKGEALQTGGQVRERKDSQCGWSSVRHLSSIQPPTITHT